LIKIFFISLFLLSTLNARENPFFPSQVEKDIPLTSVNSTNLLPLKRATISLPPQARVLQKVTLEFKNLDGSIESKSIELENSIDWHLPVFVSQSFGEISEEKKALKKQELKEFKKIASMKHATFFSLDKTLKIVTSDKNIRNFLLVEPHRIVMDFKKDTTFKSYTKVMKKNIFFVIRVGNHSGYYRIVIELDGLYRYKLEKISDGYMIHLI